MGMEIPSLVCWECGFRGISNVNANAEPQAGCEAVIPRGEVHPLLLELIHFAGHSFQFLWVLFYCIIIILHNILLYNNSIITIIVLL